MLRYISNQEIKVEGKSSLVNQCAVRFYIDGNITFSRLASDLLGFKENPRFFFGLDKKNNFYIFPNKEDGRKAVKRKDKYCYLATSRDTVNYISNVIKKIPEKNKPLEFKIFKSSEKLNGAKGFKMLFVKPLDNK